MCSPTIGNLVALSPEEVVISPRALEDALPAEVEMRFHFPRLGFVVRPVSEPKRKTTGTQTLNNKESITRASDIDEPELSSTPKKAKL